MWSDFFFTALHCTAFSYILYTYCARFYSVNFNSKLWAWAKGPSFWFNKQYHLERPAFLLYLKTYLGHCVLLFLFFIELLSASLLGLPRGQWEHVHYRETFSGSIAAFLFSSGTIKRQNTKICVSIKITLRRMWHNVLSCPLCTNMPRLKGHDHEMCSDTYTYTRVKYVLKHFFFRKNKHFKMY